MPGFGNPAATALVAVAPPDAARAAGVLRIVASVAAAGRPGVGWRAETVAADEVAICGDAAGAFLAARIDLLLRSNGVTAVVLAPDLPPALRRNLAAHCGMLGYAVMEPASLDALTAQWSAVGAGPRGWQAEVKAAAVLPDLAARVDPRHAALLLIDVQNDFCGGAGRAGRSGESLVDRAVPRLRALLASAREAGLLIVHVRAEYGPTFRNVGSPYRYPAQGRREPAVWSASAGEAGRSFDPGEVEVCLKGTPGAEFVTGMEPRPDEPVVVKHRYGAFRDTGLEVLLRANGIRTLVVGGVTTNCCVESAVREAAMRDFYVLVAADCVAVKDRIADLHRSSLESQSLYFALVRPLADLRAAWGLPAEAAA